MVWNIIGKGLHFSSRQAGLTPTYGRSVLVNDAARLLMFCRLFFEECEKRWFRTSAFCVLLPILCRSGVEFRCSLSSVLSVSLLLFKRQRAYWASALALKLDLLVG